MWRTSKKYAKLASLRELVETSEALANELFGNIKEFSTYAYGDNMDNNSYIVRIENRGGYTKVTFKYVSINPKQQLGIDRNTYIEDLSTHLREKGNVTISKRGKSHYLGDKKLTKNEYKGLIEDCPEAWAKYKKGKTWSTVGYIAAPIGVLMVLGGAGADGPLSAIGVGVALASIPAFIIGNNNKREAYKEYNKYCSKPATLSLGITSNGGVGLTLSF